MSLIKNLESVLRVNKGHWVGNGFPVRTYFDYREHGQLLSPFLLLDYAGPVEFNPTDERRGVGQHPHRGFETITYMIAGRMLHKDSAGNQGLLENGGVQWMTAGRGVFHSEIPQQEDGVMEGFQLWLNLPAKDKMTRPWYRDFTASDLPTFTTGQGVHGIVIAGEAHGVEGAVQREGTQPLYVDLHFNNTASFEQTLPATHNAVVFVYRGTVQINGVKVSAKNMAILSNDAQSEGVRIEAEEGSKALLIAGKPLNEPIAQYGPFVMNTEQEIRQALSDFRAGKLVTTD